MPHSSPAKVQPIRGQRQQAAAQSQSQEKTAPAQKPATSVHPVETEDNRAAGNSQSQQRKVLQMNVGKGGNAQQHPATPAGQHATGSFPTGTGSRNGKR
jgi:hypothetical protein